MPCYRSSEGLWAASVAWVRELIGGLSVRCPRTAFPLWLFVHGLVVSVLVDDVFDAGEVYRGRSHCSRGSTSTGARS